MENKFWLMVINWLEDEVSPERTLRRIGILRQGLNGSLARHQFDSMNYIERKVIEGYKETNNDH